VSGVAPQRVAAGWFLGFVLLALIVFACLRGAGRIVVPMLLIGFAAYALHRFVRKVREPID